MTDARDAIRSMVNNLINDNTAQADMDAHSVFVSKMKDAAGIGAQEVALEVDNDPIENTATE